MHCNVKPLDSLGLEGILTEALWVEKEAGSSGRVGEMTGISQRQF